MKEKEKIDDASSPSPLPTASSLLFIIKQFIVF